MRQFLILIVFFLGGLHISAQNSFTVLFKNALDEAAVHVIENSNHQIIAVGAESKGAGYFPDSFKGKIWQFSSPNDTLTKTFSFGDTACTFVYVNELSNHDYIVVGRMYLPPNYNTKALLILRMDASLNEMEHRTYSIGGYENLTPTHVEKFGKTYYICAKASRGYAEPFYFCILKLNENLNIEKYRVFPNELTSDFAVESLLLTRDSTQLLVFKNQGKDLAIYDTALNFLREKSFPSQVNQSTGDVEVLYTALVTAKWLTDSTFLIGNVNSRSFNRQRVWDEALGFSEMDTTLSIVPITYIGDIDTTQYPAYYKTFDFITTDSIFFTGVHNLIPAFWPNYPSWVMAGMLNRNLQQQFLYHYGGDASYRVHTMTSTSDGGFVVSATRYDYLTQYYEHDVIFLKFNSEGQIVSKQEREICPKSIFSVFPNPSSGQFNLSLALPKGDMYLINFQGQTIAHQTLHMGLNPINYQNLIFGLYLIKVVSCEQIEIKKILIK